MIADDTVWTEHATQIEIDRSIARRHVRVEDWFGFAWNREVPRPLMPQPGPQLNLGAGHREVPWARSLDKEHLFNAENYLHWQEISYGKYAAVWAHGVFEHFADPVQVLWYCEQVLMPGGVLNIVVPHGASFLYLEDLDHKHPFTEDTFRNIFDNPYYDATGGHDWKLKVHTQFIIGVAWRNLALFTQLTKEA